MLVLSRRETESVLFPQLGITIEVCRLQGNTVRLGIDAPKRIRVIRGELEQEVKHQLVALPAADLAAQFAAHSSPNRQLLQQNLDAAHLAIHLAQNQLSQGNEVNAETALDEAVTCLRELESLLQRFEGLEKQEGVVQETQTSYAVSNRGTSGHAALVIADESINPAIPVEMLRAAGFDTECVLSVRDMVTKLKKSPRPSVVLTPLITDTDLEIQSGLFPSGTLMKREFPVMFGDQQMDGWFATAADERRFEMVVCPR